MVKNRKIRRGWKIAFTVVCSLVILFFVMVILGSYKLWTSADMAVWIFLISLVSFSIFCTWKSPKWFKPLDNKLEKWAKKMRALIFEKEEKHNG